MLGMSRYVSYSSIFLLLVVMIIVDDGCIPSLNLTSGLLIDEECPTSKTYLMIISTCT